LFLQLSDKYQEFVTDSEREVFISILLEVEDWLHEGGEDETRGVYIVKLEELKKVRVVCCAEWLLLVLPLSHSTKCMNTLIHSYIKKEVMTDFDV
jgi:hypothetical protein